MSQVAEWVKTPIPTPADLAARVLKSRVQVNVMDYAGVDNTGASSSSAGFALAESDAAILGRQLYAPAGTYLVDSSFVSRVPFFGDGEGRTIIDRGSNNIVPIRLSGSKGASIALSADAGANAVALTFANDAAIASINVGAELVLRSTVAWPGSTAGKTGESVRVEAKTAAFTANTTNTSSTITAISDVTAVVVGAAISGTGIPGGTTITSVDRSSKTAVMSANATATNAAVAIATSNTLLGLEGAVDETYAVANGAVIEPITPMLGVTLAGFTVQGVKATTTSGGIMADYCKNLTIWNVEMKNLDGPGVQLNTCIDSIIDGCSIHDLTDDGVAARFGYGANISGACRGILVTTTKIHNVRHAVTTNGDVNGVPHHIVFAFLESSGTGAILDTHEDGRFIWFVNCYVHSTAGTAFRIRCPDARIINPMTDRVSAECITIFGARCHIVSGVVEVVSAQAIRFNSGATDGRVKGVAMDNAGTAGGGIRVDAGADRCIIQNVSGRNMQEVVVLNAGAGHHVKGVFGDGATNVVRVAAGASAVVRDVDSVSSTTDINNAGTILNRGTAVLVAGTVTVPTTLVKASSRISLTIQSLGTVTAPKAIGVTARVAGTSFTITSADATDTSTIAWEIQAA